MEISYQQLATTRPLEEDLSASDISQLRESVLQSNPDLPLEDLEAEIRKLVHERHQQLYQSTYTETTRRWVFESEVSFLYV